MKRFALFAPAPFPIHLLLVFCIAISMYGSLAQAKPAHKIYLTASEQEGRPLTQPATEFSCHDKIFAVIEIDGLSKARHKLDAVWRNPAGKDREHTAYEFTAHDGTARLWVWLKLHRSMEAAVVAFMNPSAGMDEFIGEWELRVAIDSKPIDVKSFSVLC